MTNDNKRAAIEKLIDKAANADDSQNAMRFSQAACNAAQAMITVLNSEITACDFRLKSRDSQKS